ncbi:type VII secretion protein EccCb [Saccharothrix deserti]|uniref:type VII secretion protein EccCb n=1 Tax=Saccharothrix deserti TaxID=2593674 RepID=UPI00131AD896|nr:type VII secretion protein EccCb [Saccharothrix deserti]
MGKRVALLIATSRYLDPKLTSLESVVEEAKHLSQLLLDPDIGDFDSAPVLLDPSKSAAERAVEEFLRDRDVDDEVLLYLTGHGIKNDYDQLFFAASDTDRNRPYATAVPGVVLQHLLEECRARSKLVLLDCCYSGTFTQRPTQRSGDWSDVKQHFGQGTFVLTASNELEFAYEQDKLFYDERRQRVSAFTDAVIKGIGTGAAARVGADSINVEDLYSFVRDEVKQTGLKQTPTMSNKSEGTFRVAKVRSRRIVVDGDSESPRLTDLLPPERPEDYLDLISPIGQAQHNGGRVDNVLRIDFAGQEGHLAVVGRIYSGKSTLVHTLMSGLAHGRTPEQISFYCLDGGSSFRTLGTFPHLKAVIAPSKRHEVERLLDWLIQTLDERDRMFRALGVTRTNTYRELRKRGALPPGVHGDLFLVIDGWEQFHDAVPLLDDAVHQIASSGLHFGVHVLVTARHWAELPPKITPLLLGRVELQLDDPRESKISPELAATLPEQPGWGLYAGRRFLTAITFHDDDEDHVSDVIRRLSDPSFPGWDLEDNEPEPEETPVDVPAPTFLEMLGFDGGTESFDVERAWSLRPLQDRYRVPLGVDDLGRPVMLDVKETAMQGMGPHGLLVGATGSGKSELLRTLVLGMLATHSSTSLNMILVDFKGGATFLGLDKAPHVAATITNLAGDLTLVDRMKDAIAGEVVRRQEVLAKGNYKNVWDYEKARENGADLDPLPLLFICVDEFSEMLTAKPDFIEIFIQIGRIGRSLGIHMLLASQSLEEGRLRGLDGFLSYRLGLKTFSAAESRAAIGVPDAYDLPLIPGSGYLSVQGSPLVRFDAAYVSEPDGPDGRSLLDVIVDRLVGQGPPAHEVWLPPLNEPPSLDILLPPLQATENRGLTAPGFFGNGRLQVPLGVVDKPFEQRRDLLWADFSGAAGHGAIVGGPQSGKSTLLRTLITSMALTHTPEEVQFYCLDLGGGTLAALENLPHVGGFASRLDVDKARRMVAELSGLISEREQRFRAQGIDSMVEFRNRKRRGEIRDDNFGDAFLVVDGWMNFRQEFEALEPMVQALAAQGLSYGVHVVVAANRWAEIRPAMKDHLGTRFELRLGDPSESEVDRRVAVNIPAGRPGRGLSPQKLHFLTALPRIDASSDAENVAAGVQDMIAKVNVAWRGRRAPQVRLLPDLLAYGDFMGQVQQARPNRGHLVPIGVNEDELAPVYLDFDADPHFMCLADGESGKTNLLRTIVRGIMTGYTSNEALIMLVDYRRTMLGYIETDHLLSYAVSSAQLTDMVKDVRASMHKRLPGVDVTQEQLKNRSWWKGPELFVVVDDYDLVAPQGGQNPLQPLMEFIPQAKDVGLHIVAVRRMGGASRAMYDPILGKLKEISAPTLVGSGSREEGVIVGNLRPSPQPPGRGTLVSRKLGQQRIQVAWIQPE